MNTEILPNEESIAKQILDKYATEVLKKESVYATNGKAGLDANKSFSYKPEKYSKEIILWKAPNNWIRIEFDGVDVNTVKALISETESNLKALEMDYCITFHKGGVSPYINICNLKGMPLNDQNKDAKLLLLDLILSEKAKKCLDKGNLSFTWTPVIEHPHWKPKYSGEVHAIVKGTNPLEQNNNFPKTLLNELKKSKGKSKKVKLDLMRDAGWVEDFLINYCCNNELPEGNRHNVINKNLAILLANREDQDSLISQYNKNNSGAGSIRGWIVAFHRGTITKPSPGELKKYIIENEIPYDIKHEEVASVENDRFDKAIKVFMDKRDLAEQFIKIQPLFYDEGKTFWIWNFSERYWERKDEVDICNLISQNSNADTIASKDKNEILEALKQVGRLRRPKNVPESWIQFKDKMVDIKTGAVKNSGHEYFCTNPIPWDLSDSKETPVLDALFEEWVGKEYVITLKQIASYCMLTDYPIHRIFCFLGGGRNGKSRYLAFIEKLIGDNNVSASELDTLMSSRFEMYNLYKKLAVQMGETNFSTMSRTAILKKLSGQDKVSFEAKNKDPISEKNYAKLLISTNNLPETDDKSDGFFRRWLCIDFPNNFPEGKDILETVPEHEYNNFCTGAVDILRDLLETGKFTNEGSVEERQKRYEERSNPFDKFIAEYCVEYDDEFIFKHDFRKQFLTWCKAKRFREPTEIHIKEKMKNLHIKEGKEKSDTFDSERHEYKRYMAWRGIGWKTSSANEQAEVQIEVKRTSEDISKVEAEIL